MMCSPRAQPQIAQVSSTANRLSAPVGLDTFASDVFLAASRRMAVDRLNGEVTAAYNRDDSIIAARAYVVERRCDLPPAAQVIVMCLCTFTVQGIGSIMLTTPRSNSIIDRYIHASYSSVASRSIREVALRPPQPGEAITTGCRPQDDGVEPGDEQREREMDIIVSPGSRVSRTLST